MRVRLWAVLGLIALLPLPTLAQRVSGEPLRVDARKQTQIENFRSARFAALPAATMAFQPLAAARVDAMQRYNREDGAKALQIALNRNVADEAESALPTQLNWQAVSGGRVARIDVRSPMAAALRVGIDPRSLPSGAEIRVAGGGFPDVYAVTAGQALEQMDGNGSFWTAVTDGESQQIELFLPSGAADAVPRISAVSHFVSSPLRPINLQKALGDSGACNIDVVCRTGTLGQAFVNAKNAVARMTFTTGSGSFTCTGTLLNDSDAATQVPYFYSANHCISLQSEANTLATFWNYEASSCGVLGSGANTQLTGGADLLYANAPSDVLFVRLRSTPPAGAFFAGWDAATVAANSVAIGIHHPSGDNKKYSNGRAPGFSSLNGGSYVRLNWSEGTTEGGSSGSGVFTLSNGQYLLRGGLYGGSASCANSNGPDVNNGNQDFYSRLDQAYPSIQQWLGNGQTSVGPTRDYTGAWFTAAEPGWGLTVFNYPGQMFALWFVYDSQGRANWYRMQGAWTGTDIVTRALERPTGAAWSSSFNPNSVTWAPVGNATLTFTSATAATLTFNDGTVSRTVTLTKI
jgi:hypothetical protein